MMNKAEVHDDHFPLTKFAAVLVICGAVLSGQRLLLNKAHSQTVELPKKEIEKQMEKEEKFWVAFLRNKDQQQAFPGAVPNAINELGKIARLRGISSTDTITVLTEYLDVHRDSLIPPAVSTPPPIILSRRPVIQEELYPAVVTFQHIGKPAIPVLLSVIENSEIGSVKSKNAVFLIKHNFREDWTKAADYLRETAESVTKKENKQRLLNAASEISRAFRSVDPDRR